MCDVLFEPRAQRELRSLPRDAARLIAIATGRLAVEPRPAGCLKLEGTQRALYRIRVNQYRVVYEIRDKALLVLVATVARRGESTYRGL